MRTALILVCRCGYFVSALLPQTVSLVGPQAVKVSRFTLLSGSYW